MRSAAEVWRGTVVHQRQQPIRHGFTYPMQLWCLDLDRLDEVFAAGSCFRRYRPAALRYCDHDYLPPTDLRQPAPPLAERARQLFAKTAGYRPSGQVLLTTLPRQWGLLFNPVSFLQLHATDGSLAGVIAEITNTPWRERHCYALDVRQAERRDGGLHWDFDKDFHISPFADMQQRYRWSFRLEAERVGIVMHSHSATGRTFTAAMQLHRQPLRLVTWRHLWQLPLGGAQILARIYWQALRLRRAGAPFYSHPHHHPQVPDPRPVHA